MDPAKARTLILVSWIFAVGGGLFTPVLYFAEPTIREGTDLKTVMLVMPIGAYAIWALFWGIVGLARHWKRNVRRVGFISFRFQPLYDRVDERLTVFRAVVQALALFVLAIEWALYLAVLLTASYLYGLLGGGIHQFLRHRRAARLQLNSAG